MGRAAADRHRCYQRGLLILDLSGNTKRLQSVQRDKLQAQVQIL